MDKFLKNDKVKDDNYLKNDHHKHSKQREVLEQYQKSDLRKNKTSILR